MDNVLCFYAGKKVLITGHTGFKGAWLSQALLNTGADVFGYALNPPTQPNLYSLAEIDSNINSVIADIRDLDKLKAVFETAKPEIVFHLAAQPIVKEGYKNPVETYSTNVMGTVNLLECVRITDSVKSVVNVTTDKVYENKEWCWGYREDDRLNGLDPYSNSKSCSELVTYSYIQSFFKERKLPISTMRAGNVIGGGDFAPNRIIPDCIRSVLQKRKIIVRNPYSIRPYQHVLEPIMAYLLVAKRQYENFNIAGCYNIGPDDKDCITTGELVDIFCNKWADGASWLHQSEINAPHEANFLRLDSSKIKKVLDWKPKWNVNTAIEKTVEWTKEWKENNNISDIMDKQIRQYI
ncbi:MAG TPA: CDP-glucose 4,6-dehydratase [Candidatus Butyricicoccus avistercoris]|uniref:CDP-glucose 4,6-dehydratase n=1 Tax=Candidatus Butyricicoccus avistercoris TaxID=2838518 RepID=A0A9D1TH81_9FIRM|nr:CDP-glucose 4,6-dehydratase [Candidatus Butyricicoccus avistercoris]